MDETHNILETLETAFGDEPWLLGDSLKKAPVKKAFSKALRKPASQLRTSDLKNLVNELWSAGHVEIIPPKDQERSFKYRVLSASPVAEPKPQPSQEKQTTETVEIEPNSEVEPSILETYTKLRQESQFRHVYIADICEQSGIAIETIHQWASQKARNREFELGQADWSLATEHQREASIKINGVHYLTVGLLS